jgi:hypothetical protein
LVVVPGLGVSNVVAVGMSLAEMKARTGDMRMSIRTDPDWFAAQIPSLGVSLDGPYRGKRRPYFGFINFHVTSTNNETSGTFNGALLSGGSLSAVGGLSRDAIVAAFGETAEVVRPATTTNMHRFMQDGTSFSLLVKGEVMYYPSHGIMFDIQDGVVRRVAVYPKTTGRTTPPTVPPPAPSAGVVR